MNTRALASVAVAAALMLGTTGCSMMTLQATTLPYSAAEGINVPDSAESTVQVRNVFFVTDEAGTSANLVGAFVNSTGEPQRASVQIVDGGQPIGVDVEANSVASFGVDGNELPFEDFDHAVGGTVLVAFQSGDGQVVEVDVPVLDGALHYLEEAVPAGGE